MRRPRRNLHTVGSFFSTDAGGRPSSAYSGVGQTPGVPPINVPGLEDILATLGGMQIPQLGLFTPWAEQVSGPPPFGYTFSPIPNPDTNIVAFEMTQVQPLLAGLGVGDPGFVAFLSDAPLTHESVRAAFSNTPYELFGPGIAVYSQHDTSGVPKAYFLYWGALRGPGDPSGGPSSMLVAAQRLGSTLVFAQQVSYQSTAVREPPSASVPMAIETQFPGLFPVTPLGPPPPTAATGPGVPPSPPPPLPGEPPPEPAYAGVLPLVGAGLLSALVGFLVGRAVKERT